MHYNKNVGDYGEKIAQNYLVSNGYKIIDTKVKISYKEIDIVAQKGDFLIFIEVKTRTSDQFGLADEGIGHEKIKLLKRAISVYLSRHDYFIYEDIGLDLISIDISREKGTAKIKHYKDII